MQLLHGLVNAELVSLGEARAFIFCAASFLVAILFLKRVRVAHARTHTATFLTLLRGVGYLNFVVIVDCFFGYALELRIKPIQVEDDIAVGVVACGCLLLLLGESLLLSALRLHFLLVHESIVHAVVEVRVVVQLVFAVQVAASLRELDNL